MQMTSSKKSPGAYSSPVQCLVCSVDRRRASIHQEYDSGQCVHEHAIANSTPLPHCQLFPWSIQMANATTTNVPTRAPVAFGGLVVPVPQRSTTQLGHYKRAQVYSFKRFLSQEQGNSSEEPAVSLNSDGSSEGRVLEKNIVQPHQVEADLTAETIDVFNLTPTGMLHAKRSLRT
ncbi:hypothetical protein HPB51_013117 [Rhipicephalus microplus]|uniref:Uncharacterized protein n=1 Tax=Rhipicephalus microplus TaxID=6941 RepID=A0A9J6F2T3_RHIMP|nr:hypothetical protein HPB51_013117 [Rhipicephalus microplus]